LRNPIKAIYWKVLKGPGTPRAAPSGLVPLRPLPVPTVDEKNHPEALALAPFCQGKGIDVGCGHRKVSPSCIGVDLIARGDKGEHGVVANQTSVADIQASGDDLHMFGDGELDYVVARHNLEHYVDVVKTLCEWRRVLKPGGSWRSSFLTSGPGTRSTSIRPTSIASLRRASSALSTRSAGLTCSGAKSSSPIGRS
jgi:SAM-dependent methyltransferase